MSVKGGRADFKLPLAVPPWPHVSSGQIPAGLNYGSQLYAGNGVAARAVNVIYSSPFLVNRTGALNRLGWRQTVNGGAGSLARAAIYRNRAVGLGPGDLIVETGAIATDVGGAVLKSAAINVPVVRGQLLWLSYLCGVAAPTIVVFTAVLSSMGMFGVSDDAVTAFDSINTAFPFAAFPAVHPAGGIQAQNPPAVLVRYA